jgi:hypothetical protein
MRHYHARINSRIFCLAVVDGKPQVSLDGVVIPPEQAVIRSLAGGQELFLVIEKQQAQLEDLRARFARLEEHVQFMPGGVGAEEAAAHFRTLARQ